MKRFLLCVMVALMGAAMWQTADARYVLGDRVAYDEIKAGDTIALWCGTQGSNTDYYMGVDESGALQNIKPWSIRASWIICEGPKDSRGLQTYFLQNLATLQFLGNNHADPMSAGQSGFGTMKDDIEYALPFSIHSAKDSSEVNEKYGPSWDDISAVFCFRDDNGHQNFLCNCAYWGIGSVFSWGEYHDTNAWNAYSVHYQHDLQGDLLALIDEISEAGVDYEAGDQPGLYPQDKVDAFNQALEEALLCSMEDHTDEEYQAAMDKLIAAKEAVENSVNPLIDTYYYIVSAFPEFMNKQGKEKAMTVNSDVQLGWTTLDMKDPKQIFHIMPLANGNFYIQNYWNDRYINGPERDASSQKVKLSSTEGYEQILKPIGSLQWILYSTFSKITYHPESHSSGNGSGGDIVVWSDNAINGMSTWYIRVVPDSILNKIGEIKAQMERNEIMSELIKEASSIWDNITTYTVSPDGLITNATDDDEECQVWSNAKDPTQGNYAALIDSTTSIFHSSWHPAQVEPMTKPHNLQFDFSKTPVSSFEMRMLQRCDSWGTQDRPVIISFYASNAEGRDALTEEDAWNFIRQIDIKDLWGNNTDDYQNWVTTPTIDLGQEYKYVRMDVVATNKNRKNSGAQYPFFSLAELQVYPVLLDEALSQYCYTEGMAEVADVMYAMANDATVKVANGTVTDADITDMRDAIAAVKALYADTTYVSELAALLEDYVSTAVIGEGIGETTEEAVNALQTAVTEARATGFTTPLVKAEVDAAEAKLEEAKAAFLATIKLPEPGKWYHILSASNLEYHYNGGDTDDPLPMANAALYADGPNTGDHVRYGLLTEELLPNYEYDPYSMWRLVEMEDGKYAVQNLGTGLYMGQGSKVGASIYTALEPVAFDVQLLGNASFGFFLTNEVGNGAAMMACLKGQHVEVGEAAVYGDGAWKFEEIDPDQTELIVIDIFANNLIDVIAVPYNLTAIADYNEDVYLYGIKKMTKNEDGTTTVELYEKEELAAGESGIIVLGDPEQECESRELVIPFPTEVTDKATPVNGVYGMLSTETTPGGTAYSDGSAFVCSANPVGIGANTGAINAYYYKGEVKDVETALTLVIEGLEWPAEDEKPADVNGDGSINTADVVAVYTYIEKGSASGFTAEAADVNGDGSVNTADVVAIYTAIIGSNGAGSPAFRNNLIKE